MFRPCKPAIIRLFKELVRRLYTRGGEYLRDEISSYIIVQGVNARYQCFTDVCTCHLKCMHKHYLALVSRWPSVITIKGNIKFIHQIHGLKQVTYKHNISLRVVFKYAKITNRFHYIGSVKITLLVALICTSVVNLHIKVLYAVLLTYT